MKTMTCVKLTLFLMLMFAALLASEARGGGRRGGSFGGIFGGWRKYKKPSSSGNSRRTTNGSPMHSTATKLSGSASGSSLKSAKHTKLQSSYPKQQMALGGAAYPPGSSYFGPHGAGSSSLPPGGAYYANRAAIPPGADYYAQRPSIGDGNFIMSMVAGHMVMQSLMSAHAIGRMHRLNNPQESVSASAGSGNRVIIVNNGGGVLNDTGEQHAVPDFENHAVNTTADELLLEEAKLAATSQSPVEQPPPSAGSIICVPLMFNEADPQDPDAKKLVTRTICFPSTPEVAPPQKATDIICSSAASTSSDIANHNESSYAGTEDCIEVTTEPVPIAGDIKDHHNES